MLDQVDDEALEKYYRRQQKQLENKNEPEETEMSFLDHLEALRWHLLRSASAILFFAIIAFIYSDFFFGQLILGPSRINFPTFRFFCYLSELLDSEALCIDKLSFIIQSRQMTGQFVMAMTYSIMTGLTIAFPYVFWEIWRFIRPALYGEEQKIAKGTTFVVSLLFFLGVAFGYYLVTPLSVNFLGNFTLDESIQNEFDITSYVSTVCTLTLVCGLLFQLPVVTYFLAKIGLLSSETMKHFKKHAIVAILFLSAILTPPDVVSQVLVALPLYVLYHVGIGVVQRVEKKRSKDEI